MNGYPGALCLIVRAQGADGGGVPPDAVGRVITCGARYVERGIHGWEIVEGPLWILMNGWLHAGPGSEVGLTHVADSVLLLLSPPPGSKQTPRLLEKEH